jgi:hypothetical protein
MRNRYPTRKQAELQNEALWGFLTVHALQSAIKAFCQGGQSA